MTLRWVTLLLACLVAQAASGQVRSLGLENLTASSTAAPSPVEIDVDIVPQYRQVLPGQRLAVAVVLTIPPEHHLYANPTGHQDMVPTTVEAASARQVRIGTVIYPPGETYDDKLLGISYRIYEGTTICYVPLDVADDARGPVSARLLIKGLLCSAQSCLPWRHEADIELPLAGATAGTLAPNRPELFEGIAVDAAFGAEASPGAADGQQAADDTGGWLQAVLLAAAAGLLMNLMPCVWPVIPIIVMTLIQHSQPSGDQPEPPSRGRPLKLGLTFAAGILVVFAVLAVVMSAFKLLYGQQFQSNAFKLALLMIVYVLGLSMFGLFEIVLPGKVANLSVVRRGFFGTFAMGMLATVLATPCGAPLLGGVLTYSLSKPLPITVAMFLIIGVGMALPYVVLTAVPGLLNRVPRAGNWMIVLKQALGFIMMGFAVYLLGLFPSGWQSPLALLCVVMGFAIWLGLHIVKPTTPPGRKWIARILAVLVALGGVAYCRQALPEPQTAAPATADWQHRLDQELAAGKTVIVKFTANWCKNCTALDKIVYQTDRFEQALREHDAVVVRADWSQPNAAIEAALRRFNSPSIPLAVIYPAGRRDEPVVLRDMYTLDTAVEALAKAASRVQPPPEGPMP